MKISNKNKAHLIQANYKIHQRTQLNKQRGCNDVIFDYKNAEIVHSSIRVFSGFFNYVRVKIRLCFLNEETAFEIKKHTEFFTQIEDKISSFRSNKECERSLIGAYTDDREKSNVLVEFKDFFEGYKSSRIVVHGDYLHIYYCKLGFFGKYEEFFLSVHAEIKVGEGFLGSEVEQSDSAESIDFNQSYFLSSISQHEKNGLGRLTSELGVSNRALLELKKEIELNSFLKKNTADKVVYMLSLFELLMLEKDEFSLRSGEFRDGVILLLMMQPEIFNIEIEANYIYKMMVKYEFDPHFKAPMKYFMRLICTNKEIDKFLKHKEN